MALSKGVLEIRSITKRGAGPWPAKAPWAALLLLTTPLPLHAADWPAYRGPNATGVSEDQAPQSWNERSIRWKAPIPGLGHSSPIITGDNLLITTAIADAGKAPLKVGLYGNPDSANDDGEQQWVLYCLDKRTGKVRWSQTARQGKPRARRHTKATHANTTLATDGKRVIALFGSEGLYSYTIDGTLEWQKDLGTLDMAPFNDRTLSWGFASSPALFEDTVIVQSDSSKDGFLAAFDAATGAERWRVPRGEVSVGSWATPAVIRTQGRTQVVANGYPFIAGYDFRTGRELWRLRGAGDVPVPTPFLAHGLIYVASAHGGKAPLYAIRPEASGDITPPTGETASPGLAWSNDRNGSYLQTPVAYRGIVYASTNQGIWKAYDAKTGRMYYEKRLGNGGAFTSSPIAAAGRLYVTNEDGQTYVIRAGAEFELLATNDLGAMVLSTPAVSEGAMYFRTPEAVIAVSSH